MVKSATKKGKTVDVAVVEAEVVLPQKEEEDAKRVKKIKLAPIEVSSSAPRSAEIVKADSVLSEKYAANYGLKELRALCKQNSIRGYSKMNKAQLAALFL